MRLFWLRIALTVAVAVTAGSASAQPASDQPISLEEVTEAFVTICIKAPRTTAGISKALSRTRFTRPSSASNWTFYHDSKNSSVAFPPEDNGASCSMVFRADENLETVHEVFHRMFASEIGAPAYEVQGESVTVYEAGDTSFLAVGPFEVAPSLFQVALAGVHQ